MPIDVPAHVRHDSGVQNQVTVRGGSNWDLSRSAVETPMARKRVAAPAKSTPATQSLPLGLHLALPGDIKPLVPVGLLPELKASPASALPTDESASFEKVAAAGQGPVPAPAVEATGHRVEFGKNAVELTDAAKKTLALAALPRTGLVVTGFAGADELFGSTLAAKRAQRVAALLREAGYQVARVDARGVLDDAGAARVEVSAAPLGSESSSPEKASSGAGHVPATAPSVAVEIR